MEKTFTKIKSMKNRRKMSLPANSPMREGQSFVERRDSLTPSVSSQDDSSSGGGTSLVLPGSRGGRFRSLSPTGEGPATPISLVATPKNNRIQRKVVWSPSLKGRGSRRNSKSSPAHSPSNSTSSNESSNCDTPTDLMSSEKLQQLRKSLRNRSASVASPSPYSVFSGLRGVSTFAVMTSSHMAGAPARRLSTPIVEAGSMGGVGVVPEDPPLSPALPKTPTGSSPRKSRRSESASTVEEEALKFRSAWSGRHGSLPVVVLNNNFYPMSLHSESTQNA